MGCNFSQLKKLKQAAEDENNNKKVLFLGLDNAGKSSILFQLKDKEFKETVPTVGLNVEQIKYRGLDFTLWDVSGQATRLWKHYFDKINAIIFVIDSNDRERIQKAQEELHKVIQDADLNNVPILLYANKQDLTGCMGEQEVKDFLKLNELDPARVKDIGFQMCSAKNGSGIWEGIQKLGEQIELYEKNILQNSVTQKQ